MHFFLTEGLKSRNKITCKNSITVQKNNGIIIEKKAMLGKKANCCILKSEGDMNDVKTKKICCFSDNIWTKKKPTENAAKHSKQQYAGVEIISS